MSYAAKNIDVKNTKSWEDATQDQKNKISNEVIKEFGIMGHNSYYIELFLGCGFGISLWDYIPQKDSDELKQKFADIGIDWRTF